MSSGGLCGQSLHLLPVLQSGSAVVLGVGGAGCATMLTEKGNLEPIQETRQEELCLLTCGLCNTAIKMC